MSAAEKMKIRKNKYEFGSGNAEVGKQVKCARTEAKQK
jgi:hypothetical protein